MAKLVAKLAKVTAPRPRRALARPRLFARIERAGTPVVWIEAPPGAGKTTLVASWLAERGRRGIRYQVDPGDADVATFFHYLALAARSATRRRLPGLPTFGIERRGAEALFARQFFRELCGALPEPFVFVLDNAHELPPGAPLLDALAAGLEEFSGCGSAVVTSRAPPPAALARSRAHGTLSVIEPAELAFTPAETRRLAVLHQSGLSPAEVTVLHERTAGWVAGLVVVLASARQALAHGGGAPASGELFPYFAAEVFERADPFTRRVLLETALLRRPTAVAATRLLGTPEAGSVLAGLARRGYFTLERGADTYEYHPLFREFLLAHGREAIPADRRAAVLRTAARLLDEDGDPASAVALLGEARAWDELARVAVANAPAMLAEGRGDRSAAGSRRSPRRSGTPSRGPTTGSGSPGSPNVPPRRGCTSRARGSRSWSSTTRAANISPGRRWSTPSCGSGRTSARSTAGSTRSMTSGSATRTCRLTPRRA